MKDLKLGPPIWQKARVSSWLRLFIRLKSGCNLISGDNKTQVIEFYNLSFHE
jgi:hypothetical protein